MKQFLIALLLLFVVCSGTAQSDHKIFLQVNTGAGYAADVTSWPRKNFVFANSYDPDLNLIPGTYAKDVKSSQSNVGWTVPVELQLGYRFKRLRVGYLLGFQYFQVLQRYFHYSANDFLQSGNNDYRIDYFLFSNSAFIGIEAYRKGNFAIAPEVSIGHYFGHVKLINSWGNTKKLSDIPWKWRVQAGLQLNIEFTVKNIELVLSPADNFRYYENGVWQMLTEEKPPFTFLHSAMLKIGVRYSIPVGKAKG